MVYLTVQLCSITLVTGLFICLRSAAKITHKAQGVTCLAAKWHACATITSFDELDDGTPTTQVSSSGAGCPYPGPADCDTDNEEGDGDDALDNTKLVPIYANTISYQKRQALGKCPETTFRGEPKSQSKISYSIVLFHLIFHYFNT